LRGTKQSDMKIIVSHDVDHLTWSEHLWKDLYIPKLWVRSLKLLLTGVIDRKTFASRINFWGNDRMNRIEELMAFERSMNVPATYFFVMRAGLGVAYKAAMAGPLIKKILDEGFDAGVHGMAYNDSTAMKEEYEDFKKLSGRDQFGIRMHYLRSDAGTRNKLAQTGYLFDSTDYNISDPYPVGNMMEFPISVMDVYAVRPGHRTIDMAKAYTLQKLEEAAKNNIPFFTINFHDMLFDPSYGLYMEWFTWLIALCKESGYSFTSFNKAIAEYAGRTV